MSSSAHVIRLTPEEYLRAELQGEIRHEYVRGQLFDMVGGSDIHNLISLNLAAGLREQLHGRPRRVFLADMKVRVATANVFYYPDGFVTCDPGDTEPYFKEHPSLIAEVLSAFTEGTDRREKFLAYELLTSLHDYVLIHQGRREVELFRRGAPEQAWTRSTHSGDEEITFDSIDVSLTLAQIYEGLDLKTKSSSVSGTGHQLRYKAGAGSFPFTSNLRRG